MPFSVSTRKTPLFSLAEYPKLRSKKPSFSLRLQIQFWLMREVEEKERNREERSVEVSTKKSPQLDFASSHAVDVLVASLEPEARVAE